MQLLQEFSLALLLGAWTTIQIALLALVLSIPLGFVGALAKLSTLKPLYWLFEIYTGIIRGVPELLIILIIYFGGSIMLSKIFQRYVEVNPFLAGAVSLACIYGAYFAECFRGALSAIPKGQIEAAQACGMSERKVFFRIKLPQLWRFALPGMGNLWLVLLKDTSLVSVIGLEDIMRKAKVAAEFTKQPFVFYLAASLLYLSLTILSLLAIRYSTARANRGIPGAFA